VTLFCGTHVQTNLHPYMTSQLNACLNAAVNRHTCLCSLKPSFNPKPLSSPRNPSNLKHPFREQRKKQLNILALVLNPIEVKTWCREGQ